MRKKNDAEALDAKRQKAREDHFKKLHAKIQDMAEGGTLQKRVNSCKFATHIGKLSDSGANIHAAWYEPSGTDTESPYAALPSIDTNLIDCIYEGGAANSTPANILCEIQDDGRPLLEHLKENDELAKKLFTLSGFSYEEIRDAFLKLAPITTSDSTDQKLNQVYFPVGQGDYHLLTVLPSTNFLCELKNRYSKMVQERVEKKRAGEEYRSYGNLICVSYGGSHPNNISVLTFQGNQARLPVSAGFFLLNSSAPKVRLDDRNLPWGEFFEHCFTYLRLRRKFLLLAPCFKGSMTFSKKQFAAQIREEIFDNYVDEIYRLRSIQKPDGGWTDEEKIHLPPFECHLLDTTYKNELTEDDLQNIAALATRKFEQFLYRVTGKEPVFEPPYLPALQKDWYRKLKLLFFPPEKRN